MEAVSPDPHRPSSPLHFYTSTCQPAKPLNALGFILVMSVIIASPRSCAGRSYKWSNYHEGMIRMSLGWKGLIRAVLSRHPFCCCQAIMARDQNVRIMNFATAARHWSRGSLHNLWHLIQVTFLISLFFFFPESWTVLATALPNDFQRVKSKKKMLMGEMTTSGNLLMGAAISHQFLLSIPIRGN